MLKYIVIALICLLPVSANATQSSRATLKSYQNSAIAANASGAVPPSVVRTLLNNLADSSFFLTGDVLSTSSGGIGVSWTDPNVDRILFWDDSAGIFASLTVGTGLSITGTTLNAAAVPVARYITFQIPGTAATGDGSGIGSRCAEIMPAYNGLSLIEAHLTAVTPGTGGSANLVQVRNFSTGFDMLSTKLMLDATEPSSFTAATPYVIDNTYKIVTTGQILCVDIDQLNTAPPVTLTVMLGFQ